MLTKITVVLGVLVATGGFSGRVAAAETSSIEQTASKPTYVFAQVGVGFVEVGHAEVGAFLGPHLTVEAMATWAGVFGAHYGGGIMYSFGQAQGRRPPRHALLVGARLMLDPTATFESHGDDLNSYGVIPVGYGFLSDSGFYLRATAGLIVYGERDSVVVSGPMVNVGIGFAF